MGVALLTVQTTRVSTSDSPEPADPLFGIDTRLLENGDLIFRRGQSLASRVVRMADAQSTYTHVGLLLLDGTGAFVVHVVPSGKAGDPAPVRVDPLTSFVDARHVSAISVKRLQHDRAHHYALLSVEAALTYARDALPFDVRFDLETEDQLYCTELVWRAYLEAGIDLVDGTFAPLQTPFGSGRYLTLSSLLNSRHLREVTSLQTGKDENRA